MINEMIQKLNQEAANMPLFMSQDGLGEKAIVYAHLYTVSPCDKWDWYLLEYEEELVEFLAFIVEDEKECRTVSKKYLEELIRLGKVEVDMHFTKKELGCVLNG